MSTLRNCLRRRLLSSYHPILSGDYQPADILQLFLHIQATSLYSLYNIPEWWAPDRAPHIKFVSTSGDPLLVERWLYAPSDTVPYGTAAILECAQGMSKEDSSYRYQAKLIRLLFRLFHYIIFRSSLGNSTSAFCLFWDTS